MEKSVYGSGKASKLTECFPSLFSNLTLFLVIFQKLFVVIIPWQRLRILC